MNENFDLLKQLYCIHSKSGNEKKMRKFIRRWINKNVENVVVTNDSSGNLYATKGSAENYPCLVSHIDQVQYNHSKDFSVCDNGDAFFGFSMSSKSFQGLGADDKNGIWVCLMCLKKYDNIKCAFFVGEEIGCVGSSKADMNFFNDCRFCLQIDRKGNSDLITEISSEMCSKEFLQDVNCESYGYKTTHGLMTDVDTLRNNGLAISCVNISCGYYNPHTDEEFTIKNDLIKCLNFVEHIIEDCTKVYTFEYVYEYKYDSRYWYTNYNYNSKEKEMEIDSLCDEIYYAISDGSLKNDEDFEQFLCSIDGMFVHLTKKDFYDAWDDCKKYIELDEYCNYEELWDMR